MHTVQPDSRVLQGLQAFLALAVLAGFVAVAAVGLRDSVLATDARPTYPESLLHVTTGISALVGGVVAAAFGATPAPSQGALQPPTIFGPSSTPALARVGRLVASAYAVVYVVVGVAAVGVVAVRGTLVADHVSALASTFLGLALVIVGAFFRPSPTAAGTAPASPPDAGGVVVAPRLPLEPHPAR